MNTTNQKCESCGAPYKMNALQWVSFAITLFSFNFVLIYGLFKLPSLKNDKSTPATVNVPGPFGGIGRPRFNTANPQPTTSTASPDLTTYKKKLDSHNKKLNLAILISLLLVVALLILIIQNPHKCPCKGDFPVTDFQLGLIVTCMVIPVFLFVLEIVSKNFSPKNLVKNTGCEQLFEISKTVGWVKNKSYSYVVCIGLFILFLIIRFWKPILEWKKETFFFEVSPARKQCLEEQVSRKNFGKPRQCSCCGKGTIGGIPPNYAQWLETNPDTGSRWHRPDNWDVVQTFSNGEEARCNNCGPPSYIVHI